jgi:hypothetical protein
MDNLQSNENMASNDNMLSNENLESGISSSSEKVFYCFYFR